MQNKRVGIIGTGVIGYHLYERLVESNYTVLFFVDSRSVGHLPELLDKCGDRGIDAVFLAISTNDTGEAATQYILDCLECSIPVITCEKGALGYCASYLKKHLDEIGYSATVGGGTRMLQYLSGKQLARQENVFLTAVLNGTLNYVFSEISQSKTLQDTCMQAVKNGYTEPGAYDVFSILQRELYDVLLKLCVLYNTVLSEGIVISPDMFTCKKLTQRKLAELCAPRAKYRCIATVSRNNAVHRIAPMDEVYRIVLDDGWCLTAQFENILPKLEMYSWVPDGVDNAFSLRVGRNGVRGIYSMSGNGAGPEPTVQAMLDDFYALCP